MRIRHSKIIVILFVVVLIFTNVLTATFVNINTKKALLEDAYIQSVCAVSDSLDAYEKSESRNDKLYAAAAWRTAVQISFQFNENCRIFKERNLLNQIYFELLRDDSHISICSLNSIVKMLREDPYDMAAYAELNELLNTTLH